MSAQRLFKTELNELQDTMEHMCFEAFFDKVRYLRQRMMDAQGSITKVNAFVLDVENWIFMQNVIEEFQRTQTSGISYIDTEYRSLYHSVTKRELHHPTTDGYGSSIPTLSSSRQLRQPTSDRGMMTSTSAYQDQLSRASPVNSASINTTAQFQERSGAHHPRGRLNDHLSACHPIARQQSTPRALFRRLVKPNTPPTHPDSTAVVGASTSSSNGLVYTDMVLASSPDPMHAREVDYIVAERTVKKTRSSLTLQYQVHFGRPTLAGCKTSWVDVALLSRCPEAVGLYKRWQQYCRRCNCKISFAKYRVRDVLHLELGESPSKGCLTAAFTLAATSLGLAITVSGDALREFISQENLPPNSGLKIDHGVFFRDLLGKRVGCAHHDLYKALKNEGDVISVAGVAELMDESGTYGVGELPPVTFLRALRRIVLANKRKRKRY
ncbi:hypothetical protein H257_10361 [Aphanomyces astaci]|uniref:Uncharacterized protein n=1 Tax=Aphanomyces astaci TaxID=112090 RepID=W4G8F6_APHAT|nr:hypothetical protein H257_10361 [Aphanomyces astaci]ETV75546.1 hypothetical protein H257_10361 [Aphanomyces astaci]|eukprot:XP_009835180.1 hypothetical protein H257_10361 [Aphanomyces astaci]